MADAPQTGVDDDDMDVPKAIEADDIDDKIMEKYMNAELIFDVSVPGVNVKNLCFAAFARSNQ